MLLKTHLDIISRNEPISHKAKFWQSYMRALKGTDDMRAPEQTIRPRSVFRPLMYDFPEYQSKLDSWPYNKSIYDEPICPHDRISTPGYRYQPISRETYGYTPRATLSRDSVPLHRPHDYDDDDLKKPLKSLDDWDLPKKLYDPKDDDWYTGRSKSIPKDWDLAKAWWDYRLADIDIKFPRRISEDRIPYALYRHTPGYPRAVSPYRSTSVPPTSARAKPIGYTYAGAPIYTRHPLPWDELLNPSPYMPYSKIARDPWWWDYPSLRPFYPRYSRYYTPGFRYSPSYLRQSYLSPIKNRYLWSHHVLRPLY